MVIYLSGPIRGNENYKAQFDAAERRILAANEGRRVKHEVINPARLVYPKSIPDGRLKEESILNICKGFLNMADAIYMLSGWEDSKGARAELAYFMQEMGEFAEVYVEGATGAKYDVLEGRRNG